MLAEIRSLLFVPATDERKLERAWGAEADAVIVDLEDAVAESAKAAARARLSRHLTTYGKPRGRLVVRINGLDTCHADEDLAAVRSRPEVEALLVPKADSDSLRALDDAMPVIALIETARGVLEASQIAASPNVIGLMIGTIDLAAELRVDVTAAGDELLHARSGMVLAAAFARLAPPIDGVWPAVDDMAGLRTEALRSRALGFGSKACIHPAQLPVVDECFAPAEAELAWARRVVEAYESASAQGRGAVAVDGRLVDRPVVIRARKLLSRAR